MYGSTCAQSIPGLPRSTSTVTSTRTRFRNATAGTPYVSTTQESTSTPSGDVAACVSNPCPSLNVRQCVDGGGATYQIRCDASIDGAVMYGLGVRAKDRDRKRAYVADFTECLQHCDPNAGCQGASYDDLYQECLLYGPIIGFIDDAGSVAALRLT